MCEKCEAIDADIAYYKQQLAKTDDRTATVLLNLLIENLESDKIGLHPQDT